MSVVTKTVASLGYSMPDFSVVCVHHPIDRLFPLLMERFNLDPDQLVPMIVEHGNMASACLPVQLAQAVAEGRIRRGDLVALIGLASGMSFGVVVLKW
jgi:3-oxoacyl-[acyl-carrier-protein] synthase-3